MEIHDEVHAWFLDPGKIADADARAVLSPEELENCDRFRVPEQGHRARVSRALTRQAVSHQANLDPRALVFSVSRRGHLTLAEPAGTGLVFNTSSTTGLAACVVARGERIGVDVELVDRRWTRSNLPKRVLERTELADLESQPTQCQVARFLDFWTLKEAYLKARGLGLAVPLNRLAFQLGDPIALGLDAALGDDARSWQFELWGPTPRHRVAVAVRHSPKRRPEIVIHSDPAEEPAVAWVRFPPPPPLQIGSHRGTSVPSVADDRAQYALPVGGKRRDVELP